MSETISVAAAACFYPRDEHGNPVESGMGVPHWQTASEGWREVRHLRDHLREYLPTLHLTLAREPGRCWFVHCAGCGYRYDEDEWLTHWPSREDAVAAATDSDWTVCDGETYCWDCKPGDDNEEDER